MFVYFDERCLNTHNLVGLLSNWRQIADLATAHAPAVSLFLDQDTAKSGEFLRRFHNSLTADQRALFRAMLFGGQRVVNWRSIAIAPGSVCKLETESVPVSDCAICETHEHAKAVAKVSLFGFENSSFKSREVVQVEKISPPEPPKSILCGTEVADFWRIGKQWACLRIRYDLNSTRPPQDAETLLGQFPDRFERLQKIERNGRRRVYREYTTGHLFYVDSLHYGNSAHLEVFNSLEHHLGTCDLEGVLIPSSQVLGRKILW